MRAHAPKRLKHDVVCGAVRPDILARPSASCLDDLLDSAASYIDLTEDRYRVHALPSVSETSSSLYMTQANTNALDIAIIGGGITGLVCAAALAKRGMHADIYEAKVSRP